MLFVQLRNGGGRESALTSWVLEGSNDGLEGPWTAVHEVQDEGVRVCGFVSLLVVCLCV